MKIKNVHTGLDTDARSSRVHVSVRVAVAHHVRKRRCHGLHGWALAKVGAPHGHDEHDNVGQLFAERGLCRVKQQVFLL